MRLIEKMIVENGYSGSDWDFEKTTKYIFELDGKYLEAGYFEHFKENELMKTVIELPQSYGCAAKCRFCASAAIETFGLLNVSDMQEMFEYLYEENQLEQQQYVLLTMTGMGDIFFNYENVAAFLLQAGIKENLHVTLSSCLWNDQLLDKVKLLCGDVHIRNIQITYVSDDSEKAMEIIPFYKNLTYDFHKIVSYIERHTESYYRINYIVIKGVNDSEEDVHRFSQVIKTIRNKVVVRVSQLNETGATKRNQLQTTDVYVLEHLQQILQRDGIKSYVFYAHKNDNMNCGQLITEKWGK